MKLYREIIHEISGFGYEANSTYTNFIVSDTPLLDEPVITQEDVVEEDEISLYYSTYEEIREITNDEYKLLKELTII